MRKFGFFMIIATLIIFLTTACRPNIKTGSVQTVDIQVPMPEASSSVVDLTLAFDFGDLILAPGKSEYLVMGSSNYNAEVFKPMITKTGSSVILSSGENELMGVLKEAKKVVNEWNLQLSKTPMHLKIQAGPYDGNIELGGLSLEELYIDEVGSSATIGFSTPNKVEMTSFNYQTGGSTIKMSGLANANFNNMDFKSGAGDYTLSFDGTLQREANVVIESGAATITIIVPENVNTTLTFEGGMTSINTSGTWKQNGNVYSIEGDGPVLTIKIIMGMGTINLESM